MRLIVAVVGRVRGHLADAVSDYETRAGRYWRFETVEVSAGLGGRRDDPEAVMAAEGERLLARIPSHMELAALTRDGAPLTSSGLADQLREMAVRGHPGVAFVIGGAYGLHRDVLARARRRISLSAMTLPHEMARLILAEQIYRAGTISRGEPYHKGL